MDVLIALGIRLAIVAMIIGAFFVVKHNYDDSIREPLVKEFAAKEQAYNNTIDVQKQTISRQSTSLADARRSYAECTASISGIQAAREQATADAAKAQALAKAAWRASQPKLDALAAIAKGPEIRGDVSCAMARQIGSEYAKDVLEILGLR